MNNKVNILRFECFYALSTIKKKINKNYIILIFLVNYIIIKSTQILMLYVLNFKNNLNVY